MKHLTLTLKSSDLQDTGQFEGHASTFGNVDQGGDLIEPGAFRESVAKARAEGWGIPMLWQHDQREPIGVWRDIFEDDRGLSCAASLSSTAIRSPSVPMASWKHGALAVCRSATPSPRAVPLQIPDKAGVLRLKKIELREISLVTMPMNTEAKVTAVKTVTDGRSCRRSPILRISCARQGSRKARPPQSRAKALSHCSGASPAARPPPTSCRHSPRKSAAVLCTPRSYPMTDTKSAEQLAGEVKVFDAQQQAVKKDFDTRHDEVKALAEEDLARPPRAKNFLPQPSS